MSVERFTVQSTSIVGIIALLVLVFTGIVLLALAGKRAKTVKRGFAVLLIVGIAVIGVGVYLFFASNTPSTITVGAGYVNVESPGFAGAGNINVTSNEIASAYVSQVGTGNLTLAKQHGTNYDRVNIGIFTLGNGATAYVVSNNSTNLIIQLDSGEYVILGTSNTNALAQEVSQYVYPLS